MPPRAAATTQPVIRLRNDATLTAENTVELAAPRSTLRFKDLPAGVLAALRALASDDVAESDLTALALASGSFTDVVRLQLILRRLDAEGLLEHAVLDGAGEPLARLRPIGLGPTVLPTAADPAPISRFAVATVEHGRLVVRAPHSHLAVEFSSADLLLNPDIPEVARLFAAAGLFAASEEPDEWHPADWWFHSRSRNPRTVAGYGGTYRHSQCHAPLPAIPEPRGSRTVKLAVPQIESDLSLTATLESRRSIREHDAERPITRDQLAELLYRTARTRGRFPGTDGQEFVDRPYPSGGAVHELELYPLITACDGLEPGLWHYRSEDHALELVAEPGPATTALVAEARAGSVMEADPQVTLIVAARFGRVFWKYETVGYPLILKHVGVLYQTIYLVATAMGLAVCGLGGGNTATFAAATGLQEHTEASVGELVLGSRPAVLRHPLSVARESLEASS